MYARFFFKLSLFLTLAGTVMAGNYYAETVSEISSAMNSIQPGDTLFLASGEWKDVKIYLKATGTSEQPIVVAAEKPGNTRITGASYLRMTGEWLVVDGLYFTEGYAPSGSVIEFRYNSGDLAKNCRLTNTAIVNFNPSSNSTDYKWVSLYGTNNRVDHCYLAGKTHSGTTLVIWLNGSPNYHRIDHNYFGPRPDLGENGGETIRVGTSDYSMSDSYTLVENNYFEHCNGEIEIISNKSCENTYRYNTFYECQGTLTLRHGNRCYVYSNFFIGNNKYKTGGIRIIGESHKVYNNYLMDLDGDGYRSAIAIMNGVPDSPLNRYFQVKNAQVVHNTIVNCYESMELGAGANSELSLPPKDCIIANNVIQTTSSKDVITVKDEPENLTWEGNIFWGKDLGITQPAGISWLDPQLELAADSLWRPAGGSPVIGAAVGSYAFISEDMDGQTRSGNFDVGADQISTEPIVNKPMDAETSGPDWYPPAPIPPTVLKVQAGTDSLRLAVERAQKNDIIELVTDGGVYENSTAITINKTVLIRLAEGVSTAPSISQTADGDSARAIFSLASGGTLRLNGVILDGAKDGATPARYAFRTTDGTMSSHFNLYVQDCTIKNFKQNGLGAVLRATAGSFADSIRFEDCLITDIAGTAIRLDEETEGSGKYNVENLVLRNCTFWNLPDGALSVYAGDDIMFTACPFVTVDHCTFDNCASDGAVVVDSREVDFTEIKNSIFTNSPAATYTARLYGAAASIHHCDLFNTAGLELNRSAHSDAGMLEVDPLYADAAAGDFTLAANSPLDGTADDGLAMGDPRWNDLVNPIFENEPGNSVIRSSDLLSNYPNPFNPQTTITFRLQTAREMTLKVIDMRGRLVKQLTSGFFTAGTHKIIWQAAGNASGVYFAVLSSGSDQPLVQKMILLR